MTSTDTLLERRIAEALNERADSLPPFTPVFREVRQAPRGPQQWRVALVAAVVVVIVAAGVAVVRPFAGTSGPSSPASTTVPAPSTTTLPPPPAGVVGPEVPLQFADNSNTQFLIRLRKRQDATSTSFAVQIPGHAALVVTGPCMTIAVAPPDGTGYQGSCALGPDAATRVIGTLDTGANETPTSTTYGAWVSVPKEAAYVTFTYGDQHAWQRPLNGVSYFTQPGNLLNNRSTPVIFQAFNDAGELLGEARA